MISPSVRRLVPVFAVAASMLSSAVAVPAFAGAPRVFGNPSAATSQTFQIKPVVWPLRVTHPGALAKKKLKTEVFDLTPAADRDAYDITVGKDGNLWISTNCAGLIERLTPKGVATQFSYATPSGDACYTSTSITPGPDGDLWFVDQFANVVGKITTKGVITTYPLPAQASCNIYPSAPLGIVAGSDGAMWFTLTQGGNEVCAPYTYLNPGLGRITKDGEMTFFTTAPPGASAAVRPQRITSGRDGNLYFVADHPIDGPQLGVGEFSIQNSTFSYTPDFGNSADVTDYLTFGLDGNLWVTDTYDSEIFRVSMQSSSSGITGFNVGSYNGKQESPYGITTGPDKNLWFTTYDDNELGQITPSGNVTFYPTASCSPDNCGTGGGIVKRKKSLWFALADGSAYEVEEALSVP